MRLIEPLPKPGESQKKPATCAEAPELGTPIAYLLSQISLKLFAEQIELKSYSQRLHSHFHYDVEFMLKLVILMTFRKIPYRKVQYVVTEEDIEYLCPVNLARSGMPFPSKSTIHNFVTKRLGLEGADRLQAYAAEQLKHYYPEDVVLTIDSTPLDASRHNADAPYHPHYKGHMDKANIIQVNSCPLALQYSNGLEADNAYVSDLCRAVKDAGISVKGILLDKGYDDFKSYTEIYDILHAIPYIIPKDNAVIEPLGDRDGMGEFMKKLWKHRVEYSECMDKNLEQLLDLRRKEMLKPESKQNKNLIEKCEHAVGGYFRNDLIRNPELVLKIGKDRRICESRHSHIKKIVDFNIQGMRTKSKRLYVTLRFAVYQILKLAHLQLGIQNNNFGNYI